MCTSFTARFNAVVVAILLLVFPAIASAQTFKIATWNIKGGQGKTGLDGHPSTFVQGSDCTQNAWGTGFVQDTLINAIKNDSSVVALALEESYANLCGNGDDVLGVLGWRTTAGSRPARTSTLHAVVLLAKYGIAGQASLSLDQYPTDPGAVVLGRVCLNSGCSSTVDVYAAHWYATGTDKQAQYTDEATATINFMSQQSGSAARILAGDLNVWEGVATCGHNPMPWGLDQLRAAGYTDAWPAIHGTAEGFTGTVNTNGCGSPNGYAWKRIDYAWAKGYTVTAVTRFGVPAVVGDEAPSDHYGLIASYGTSAPDTTPPTASITSPTEGQTVSGTISVTATASDNVGVHHVDLLLDGSVAQSDSASPYTFSWDTTTVSDGSHTLQASAYDAAGNRGNSSLRHVTVNNGSPPPPPSGNVTWTSIVNATATGSSLQKTSGCATCGDAGGVSQQMISGGDGSVQFTPSAGYRMYAGLGTDTTTSTDPARINFAFSFWTDGSWDVRESNVYRKQGTFVQGDVFKVAIVSGVVKYYKNDVVVYTSTLAPVYPLVVDATFYTMNGTIASAVFTNSSPDVTWTSLVNSTATGSTLQKTSGCGSCADAGGVSQQSIVSGNGYVQFTPSTGSRFYAGLGTDDTTNTDPTHITFGFSFWTSGTWDIRESGVYRTEGTYVQGDVFKVSIEGSAVKYYKNGVVVYTSPLAPVYPLVVDTTFYSIGASVSNVTVVK